MDSPPSSRLGALNPVTAAARSSYRFVLRVGPRGRVTPRTEFALPSSRSLYPEIQAVLSLRQMRPEMAGQVNHPAGNAGIRSSSSKNCCNTLSKIIIHRCKDTIRKFRHVPLAPTLLVYIPESDSPIGIKSGLCDLHLRLHSWRPSAPRCFHVPNIADALKNVNGYFRNNERF